MHHVKDEIMDLIGKLTKLVASLGFFNTEARGHRVGAALGALLVFIHRLPLPTVIATTRVALLASLRFSQITQIKRGWVLRVFLTAIVSLCGATTGCFSLRAYNYAQTSRWFW